MFDLFVQYLQKLLLNRFFVLSLLLIVFVTTKSSGRGRNQPPSPRKLPIIGNLHQLGPLLHRSFLALSQRYGKVMLLHLGNKPTVVVSSVDAVREIMRTHDRVFSNRPESRVAKRIFYDSKDVAFASYGEHWRQMKSICVLHLLSNQKVQSFRTIREQETDLVIDNISRSRSSVINLSEIAITFTNDVICRAAFGKKYNSKSDGGIIFEELLHEVIELLGVICLGDFIPCLSWVDRLKGLNARMDKAANDLDEFLEKVIQEHQYHNRRLRIIMQNKIDTERDVGKKVKNFVDILLELQSDNKDVLPSENLKAVILDMFVAGTETTYTVIEWTMSELINHPRIMTKLQEEVRKIGGASHRICEDDLEKLPYLKAVLKEALRLHPPAPLLVFREASQDVKVNEFDIAAGTRVAINAWAIQRDPAYWEEPEEFRPERFLTNNTATTINYKGNDNLSYFPFGGGRRLCPGISFGVVSAELFVANLINEFNWNLPGGPHHCGKVDMTESVGITIHKQAPLLVIATPYSTS